MWPRFFSSDEPPQPLFSSCMSSSPPPPAAVGATTTTATSSGNAAARDSHHFILFQHGVLGYAGDFENVITELFVHHDVSLMEARETEAETAAAAAAAAAQASGGGGGSHSAPHGCVEGTNAAAPTASFYPSQQQQQQHQREERRSAQRRASRREAYKRDTFRLNTTYPFNRSSRLYQTGRLICFGPGANNFHNTGAGTQWCARRMLSEFIPVFRAWLEMIDRERQVAEELEAEAAAGLSHDDGAAQVPVMNGTTSGEANGSAAAAAAAHTPTSPTPATTTIKPIPICFSCVGHSFGGLILREFLYLLIVDTIELPREDPRLYSAVLSLRLPMMRLQVQFENFLTVATPHCGTAECLWWPIYLGAWVLAHMYVFRTYGELIVSDGEELLMKRLVNPPHVTALKVFRRRTLFSNTHRDLLVGFGTSSLIFETVTDDHTKARGYWRRGEAPCAAAFESDDAELSAVIHLAAHRVRGDLGSDGRTKSLPNNSNNRRRGTITDSNTFHPLGTTDLTGDGNGASQPFDPTDTASHTLFDIWEFHHTRTTTTIAPVDPLVIVGQAAEVVARAAASVAGGTAHSNTDTNTNSSNTPSARARSAGRAIASGGEEHNRGSGGGGGGVCDQSISMDDRWFHYDRFFPDASPSSTSSSISVGNDSHDDGSGSGNDNDNDEEKDGDASSEKRKKKREARATARRIHQKKERGRKRGKASDRNSLAHLHSVEVTGDPATAIPPPSLEFPLSKVISHDAVLQRLRAVLSPSLSATTTTTRRDRSGSNINGNSSSSSAASGGGLSAAGAAAAATTTTKWLWPAMASLPLPGRFRFSPTDTNTTRAAAAAAVERAEHSAGSLPVPLLTAPLRLAKAAVFTAPLAVATAALHSLRALLTRITSGGGGGGGGSNGGGDSSSSTAAVTAATPAGKTTPVPERVNPSVGYVSNEDEGDEDEEEACIRRLIQEHLRSLPPSRLTPRAIAHELRRDLDWRVRAVRCRHVIPTAHVASLGNWAWAGTSPNLVKAVAEEIAHIM